MCYANRSEIIFLYDISWANPNGDPLDANKPRIDMETGINFVTDVRLKRTIRDELYSMGYEVLIRDTFAKDGTLSDAKRRALDFMPEGVTRSTDKLTPEQEKLLQENILDCLDIRLFGCTLPFELKKQKSSVTYTGPVQFKVGYSMHPVKCEFIKGTGAFASGDDKEQKTFRQEYVLPYSLIMFYGIINDRAAKKTHLKEDDVNLLLEAMWNGTKNLISRTKAGQMPRMMLRIVYKNDNFHIGELDKYIKFNYEKEAESLRDIKDGVLLVNNLAEKLISYKENIEFLQLKIDDRLTTDIDLKESLEKYGLNVVIL